MPRKKAEKKTAKKTEATDSAGTADMNEKKGRSAIIRELIRLGKDKGFLSYQEVNSALPESLVSSGEIDNVISTLAAANIRIVESEDEVDRIPFVVKKSKKEVGARKVVQIDDPVKMYLKQMGQISLLSRAEELELAQRIKKKEKEYKDVVFGVKTGKERILATVEEALDNEYNLDEVLDVDPGVDLEKLRKKKKRLIKR
ncbi:MAG: hypothetical protein KAS86_03610, partial [Candidatus Omnitrophica bacterium]|nr:hypothetical protein [Candidatus Omnitrophota bacterium]